MTTKRHRKPAKRETKRGSQGKKTLRGASTSKAGSVVTVIELPWERLKGLADAVEDLVSHIEAVGYTATARVRSLKLAQEEIGPLIEEVATISMSFPDGQVLRMKSTDREVGHQGEESVEGGITDGQGNILLSEDAGEQRSRVLDLLEVIRLVLSNRARMVGGQGKVGRLRLLARELTRAVARERTVLPTEDCDSGARANASEPLTARARAIKGKLESLRSDEAMTLPQIQEWYETEANLPLDTPKSLSEGTWKRVRRELLPHGLQNRQNVGYFIAK